MIPVVVVALVVWVVVQRFRGGAGGPPVARDEPVPARATQQRGLTMEESAPLQDFRAILATIRSTTDSALLPEFGRTLSAAAHAARRDGQREAVESDLDAATEAYANDKSARGQATFDVLFEVAQERMDAPLLTHQLRGFQVERVRLRDGRFNSPGIGVAGQATPAGTLLPVSTREGERTLVTMAGGLWVLGNSDLADFEAVRGEHPPEHREHRNPLFLPRPLRCSTCPA